MRRTLLVLLAAIVLTLGVVGLGIAATTAAHLKNGDNLNVTCPTTGVQSYTKTNPHAGTVSCRKSTPTTAPTTTAPTSPTTTPATGGNVCVPGNEEVVFNGQGSSGLGMYGEGDYDASAEEWGVSGYNYTQKMGVCHHDSWYVNVTTDNSRGDGAVKAYPSMRRFYHDWGTGHEPLLSTFPRVSVSFASTDPAVCPGCIYDTAFDVWANQYNTEIMIWTHNVAQTPAGSVRATGVQLAGHTWTLWATSDNSILSFVPTDTGYIQAGTFDMLDFTRYLQAQGRMAAASTLGQVSFGVETVSTGAVERHWDFTDFSIVDN